MSISIVPDWDKPSLLVSLSLHANGRFCNDIVVYCCLVLSNQRVAALVAKEEKQSHLDGLWGRLMCWMCCLAAVNGNLGLDNGR